MKSILTLIIVNKVYLKNHEEIELIRESSLIVSKTLGMLAAEIKPGVNGLELDKSVLIDFEKKVRHKNYLFSNGIDFIYEFFKLESKISSNILSKSIQLLGKNKIANNFFTNSADNGII